MVASAAAFSAIPLCPTSMRGDDNSNGDGESRLRRAGSMIIGLVRIARLGDNGLNDVFFGLGDGVLKSCAEL